MVIISHIFTHTKNKINSKLYKVRGNRLQAHRPLHLSCFNSSLGRDTTNSSTHNISSLKHLKPGTIMATPNINY